MTALSVCTCGHLESFHDEPPGSVCIHDNCSCQRFSARPHARTVTQTRFGAAVDLVCVTCNRVVDQVSA